MRTPSLLVLPLALACNGGTLDDSASEVPLPDGEDVFESADSIVEITAMRVLVLEIVADGDRGDTSLSETIAGTFDIDILAGTSEPELEIVEFGPGTWESFYYAVELDDAFAGRDAVELDADVWIGEATEPVPMQFRFDSGEVFEITSENPVVVEEGLFMDPRELFHPSRWFPDVAFAAAEANSEGVIVLDATTNVDLFNTVADALDRSTQASLTDGTFGY